MHPDRAGPLNRDILSLLCPDWRGAAMVVDCARLQVLYANWRCLELVQRGDLIRIPAGRLNFVAPEMTRRVGASLDALRGTEVETTVLMSAGHRSAPSYSVAIRRPRGLLGESLARHAAGHGELAVLEFSTSEHLPGLEAFEALGEAFRLTGAELRAVMRLLAHATSTWEPGFEEPGEACVSAMAKLDCKAAGDVVRLVMSLSPLEFRKTAPAPVPAGRETVSPTGVWTRQ